MRFLANKGYSVIEVGDKQVVSTSNKNYIDYTSNHNIQNIARVISKADLFIGIDSAFAHIANAFEIPGIIILGRYKNFEKYEVYSGFYSCGGCKKVFARNNEIALYVSVKQVKCAIQKMLLEQC